MIDLVWSEHCGKMLSDNSLCGKRDILHLPEENCGWHDKDFKFEGKCNAIHDHEFVRVPLNFDEWRKELAEKLANTANFTIRPLTGKGSREDWNLVWKKQMVKTLNEVVEELLGEDRK